MNMNTHIFATFCTALDLSMITRLKLFQRLSTNITGRNLHAVKVSKRNSLLKIVRKEISNNYALIDPLYISGYCKTCRSHRTFSYLKNDALETPLLTGVRNTAMNTRNIYLTKMAQKTGNIEQFDEVTEMEGDREYEIFARRMLHLPEMGHQVLVVQPYIKWGPGKKTSTTPDLQLRESVALINSLSNWKVIDSTKIALQSMERKALFGSGNLAKLREKILKNKLITAVFISTDILRGYQRRELENAFNVPVFDRYMIVIQIFREHAVSREAKLQVAMAEIPYLRMRLKAQHEGSMDHYGGGGAASIGGPGESPSEVHKRLLNAREQKLKQMLDKLRNHRTLLRNKRQRSNFPTVAVVGYTNAGKTSLIKALTGESTLEPKDYLFATLDVTAHAGLLPCQLKVLYMDTVGFISDLPTRLIESFVATLEDALLADVIIHVRDVSHPDTIAQAEVVTSTLRGLNLSPELLENIIVVGNKVDLVPNMRLQDDILLVSAVKQQGIDTLLKKVEAAIMKVTGRVSIIMRVLAGSEESRWLQREAAVTEIQADDENPQYQLMKVVISNAQLNKFKHRFIGKK